MEHFLELDDESVCLIKEENFLKASLLFHCFKECADSRSECNIKPLRELMFFCISIFKVGLIVQNVQEIRNC